jgi:hypothetical protein
MMPGWLFRSICKASQQIMSSFRPMQTSTTSAPASDVKMMDFLGVKLSVPAYIVLIASIILVIMQSIFLISRSKRSKMLPHVIIINIVLMLLLAALNVYIVNCLTVGNCDALAIIITGLYLLAVANALIYFVTHNGGFMGLRGNKKA